MKLDTTFLSLHPRTALWFKQREKCERCAHCHQVPVKGYPSESRNTSGSGGWLMCLKVPFSTQARRNDCTCITARDEGAACGPDAQLFEEKT